MDCPVYFGGIPPHMVSMVYIALLGSVIYMLWGATQLVHRQAEGLHAASNLIKQLVPLTDQSKSVEVDTEMNSFFEQMHHIGLLGRDEQNAAR